MSALLLAFWRGFQAPFHDLAHLFGLNSGTCYSWWEDDKLMMGFRCFGCDTISQVHDTGTRKD